MIKDNNTKDATNRDACVAVAHDVIERAKRCGTEIIVWRNNKIVRLTPEEALRELE